MRSSGRQKESEQLFLFLFVFFVFLGGQVVLCIFLFLFEILPNKINKIKLGDFRGDFFVSFSRETQLIPSGDFIIIIIIYLVVCCGVVVVL